MKKLVFIGCLFSYVHFAKSQGNSCSNASVLIPSNTCNYQSFLTTGTEFWMSFVAQSKYVNISLVSTKFGDNVPHIHNLTLYSGSCNNLTFLADDELPFIFDAKKLSIDLNASDLVPGNTYYLKAKREASHQTCDKNQCKANNSSDPAAFDICIENIDIIIPLDFGFEDPSPSHAYEQNRGQLADYDWNPVPEIKMFTKGAIPNVFIAENFTSFVYEKKDEDTATFDSIHRVDMIFPGASNNARLFKTEQVPGYSNYYLEHIPQGITGNKSFSRIVHKNVWPLIDVQYYSNNQGLKFYFVVKEGGEADVIKLKFEGANSTSVTQSGGLKIETELGSLVFEKPHVYRINPAGNIVPMPASGAFVQTAQNEYKIYVQNYPANMPLVIQVDRGHGAQGGSGGSLPEWCTYLGGSSDDFLFDITDDPIGNIYVAGRSASTNFPVINAYQTIKAAWTDAVLGKFDIDYSQIWTTFYGGADTDVGYGISHSDFDNKVYICGSTSSFSPTVFVAALSGFPNSYVNSNTTQLNGFIARFDDANGFREWGTFFGGFDSWCRKIKCDENGNVFVVGSSFNNSTTSCAPLTTNLFPICNPGGGAFVQVMNNFGPLFGYDCYISRFNSNTELTWSTFFGGDGDDFMENLAIDNTNDKLYIVGATSSVRYAGQSCTNHLNGFPLCNANGYYDENLNLNNTTGTGDDGFISRFNLLTGKLEWSTFFGGNNDDGITGIDVSSDGTVYIAGYTLTGSYTNTICAVPENAGFPNCVNSQYTQNFGGGGSDAFVAKFDLGTNLGWSTFLGAGLEEEPERLLCGPKISISPADNIFVSGNTRSGSTSTSTIFPILNSPAFYNQSEHDDSPTGISNTDCYITGFNSAGQLIWSSYFGGMGTQTSVTLRIGDIAAGITTFQNRVYTCGATFSTSSFPLNCPATSNPYCQGTGTISPDYSDGYLAQFNLNSAIGVNDISNAWSGINIFPNPASDEITLQWMTDKNNLFSVLIYDELGKLVFSKSSSSATGINEMKISTGTLESGIYFISVSSGEKIFYSKLVKLK